MNDEEEDVLAALHASLRDQSAYEEEVIRDATHSLAPSLPAFGGLPPLASLSNTGALPTALVHEVLTNVRRKMKDSPDSKTTDLLCFKEQMLLSYLETVCGQKEEDDTGPSIQEQRRQERRKRQLPKKAPPPESQPTPKTMEETAAATMIPRRATTAATSKRRKVQQMILDEHEDPLQLTAKERREVFARREERRKRKQARRKQTCVEDEEDSEEEAEFMDDGEKQEEMTKGKDVPITAETQGFTNDNTKSSEKETAPLTCPLCSLRLEAASEDDVERDAMLAVHMQECQSGRRSTARRARRRSTASSVSQPDHEVDLAAPAAAPLRRKTSRGTQRKSTLPGKWKKLVSQRRAQSIDDFDEIDYEDRVDDWIQNGLSRMKEMKERIETGEVVADDDPWQNYGNGDNFFVPAWIHRRLFGYQREGLKWLWGLHQQGCGGCLGDEVSQSHGRVSQPIAV